MEQATFNLQAVIQAGAALIALWGFYKAIMEIIKSITERHDREKAWDKAVSDIQEERQKIVERYDKKLMEIEGQINDSHSDTEAKIQELKAEMLILTKSVAAILDGLKQQGCNGEVTKTKEALDAFLMNKAYD